MLQDSLLMTESGAGAMSSSVMCQPACDDTDKTLQDFVWAGPMLTVIFGQNADHTQSLL